MNDCYIQRLKDRVFALEDEFKAWERGLVATEVCQNQPDLPAVIKRAKIIEGTLSRLSPIIFDEEWICGYVFRDYPVHSGVSSDSLWKFDVAFPELCGYRQSWPIEEHIKEKLRYWEGKSIVPKNETLEQHSWIYRCGIASPQGTLGGHTLPDHGILLQNGIGKLSSIISRNLDKQTDKNKKDEFMAMKICLDALGAFCLKYAKALERRANHCDNEVLKERLIIKAQCMKHISSEAPQTLLQALQLLFFSHFIDQLDCRGDASSFGRVDQLLYPFYQRDIEAGTLTRQSAFELVCHFIVKNWKPQASCNMTIGGLKPDGSDAVNDVSYLFLEGMAQTNTVVDLSVRLHPSNPDAFYKATASLIRMGMGRPSVYNDEMAIRALTKTGVEIEDARNYAPLGCAEVMIPGLTSYRTMGLQLYTLKVLELVLNKGVCAVTGERIFDDIPDDFESYEELIKVYREKLEYVIHICLEASREDEKMEVTYHPRPWLTLLAHGGVEKGIDLTAELPKYQHCGKTLASVANTVNSLYCIKRLVFEEKKLSIPELRTILNNNWEGQEALRQYILNRLPRYGQDNAEVNEITKEEAAFYAHCLKKQKTHYGGQYWPMIFGLQYTGSAPKIGASACGRKAGDAVAATLQPTEDGARGSLFEVLSSVASIDYSDFAGGVSNVQDFDPSLFSGEDGLDRLVNVIKGFFAKGGMELGINFQSVDTLLDAKANPKKYAHLMVRLFGLSARFVTLSEQVQDAVIEKMRAAAAK